LQIRRCIREDKVYDVQKAFHYKPCGRQFVNCRTGHKDLKIGYYWPTIFKYENKYAQAYDSWKRMGRPSQADEITLQPQLVVEPFERLALDFVGPFNSPSNKKFYILVVTDYVTKWVKQ